MVLVLFVIYSYLYFYLNISYCKVLCIVHTHVSYTTSPPEGGGVVKKLCIDNSFIYVFFLIDIQCECIIKLFSNRLSEIKGI